MSKRAIPTWQVVLSDLALILFLTTLAALQGARATDAATPEEAVRSHELAVYREGAGGLSLPQWLARQASDPRVQVTVLARFAPDDFAHVSARAHEWAQMSAAAGKPPRLVIEPSPGRSDVIVSLAYDSPNAASQAHSTRLRPDRLAR